MLGFIVGVDHHLVKSQFPLHLSGFIFEMTSLKPPPLWLIALGTGSAVMGITLITPALPVIASELDVSSQKVQRLLTFYLALLAVGQLFYGPLSDAYGRRYFFISGAFLIGLSGLIALFISDIEVLTLLRALQGLGAAACIATGRTMLSDFYQKLEAAKAMASVQTIQAVVPMFSLAAGGAIVYYFGWQGVMSIIAFAGLTIAILGLFLLPETHQNRTRDVNIKTVFAGYKAVLGHGLFMKYLLISSLQIGVFFSLNAFIPYSYERMGVNAVAFGIWFGLTPLSYITGNLMNRLYFVKTGVERTILIGCVLTLIGMSLMIIFAYVGWNSPFALVIPCLIFGFGNGLTVANSTIGGISTSKQFAGTASGLIGSMTMVMGAFGGALVIFLGASQSTIIGGVVLWGMLAISLMCAVSIYRVKLRPAS